MKEYNYKDYRDEKIISSVNSPGIIRKILLLIIALSLGILGQLYMENHLRIYDNTLRFHVRAASDDKLEQELKLSVRDSVLAGIRGETARAVSARQLETSLGSMNMQAKIKDSADSCLKKQGYERKVKVYFTKERFPLRRYGAIIFPAGVYHALRVDIGDGKGHNWWCALYPELCYNKEEFALSEKGKQDLKDIFFGPGKKPSAENAVRCASGAGTAISGAADKIFPGKENR